MEAFTCTNLTKRIGGHTVVDGLNLSVRYGEVFGFLGPNGAGKTTTIRMILGLSAPSAGSVHMLGVDVRDHRRIVSRVGALVEEPAFYPWMTGRKNLRVFADAGPPLPSAAIETALELAGIAPAAGRRVRGYSQGMRQRLGLALALMRDPDVLILDEPANGLDPAGIRDLRDLVRKLGDTGKAVFLSSHQLREVEDVCDRVAIIDRGRLVVAGEPAQLRDERSIVRVVVAVDDEVAAAAALRPIGVEITGPGRLAARARSGREVAELLQRVQIVPESIVLETETLEERFLALTTGEEADALAKG
jgi:ABC-2 type transport system ATP-binding protein